jgi:uncharacterized protein with GYD domain
LNRGVAKGGAVPTFIGLINWTDEGIKGYKETVDRAAKAEELAETVGGRVLDIYWTLGEHDIVVIFDAPDDETATAFLLATGSLGNIRTKTLRAFNREEMQGILDKTP